ncbi:MAG: DUF4339 domain-containing protein, partial [Treponema sp.]|nr:DUF4339 domain-containing protein [Treponema sp.]MCL2250713.1 DUF4339 domain-containing protein [Treponema sp.]
VWKEGMKEWAAASAVKELSSFLPPPAPPPPAPKVKLEKDNSVNITPQRQSVQPISGSTAQPQTPKQSGLFNFLNNQAKPSSSSSSTEAKPAPPSSGGSSPASAVKFDGIYTFQGGYEPNEYLRFYSDGRVIFAMLPSNHKIKIDWFVKGQKRQFKERSVGESGYKISGRTISFSIWYHDSFMVIYNGEIMDNGLLLRLQKDSSIKTRDFKFTKL